MSCRDTLPLVTQLRIQAATMAANSMSGSSISGLRSEAFTAVAKAAFEFITTGLDLDALADKEKKAVSAADRGPKARMEFLATPARELTCEHASNAMFLNPLTVRGLVKSKDSEIVRTIGPEAHRCLQEELGRHGLRFAMNETDLTLWIARGQSEEESSTA